MDSEELSEINELKREGRPETTKGPYYHKAWWEAYKGGVKGILGGVIIGGVIGSLIGVTAVGALSLMGFEVASMVGAAVATSAAFGMYKGAEKFESVGISAGSSSATQEIAEVRMKEYVREKFREVINEIRDLVSALKGNKPLDKLNDKPLPFDNSPVIEESDFRTNHLDEHIGPHQNRFFYPMVMAIGTFVGAAAGAILGYSEFGAHILNEVLGLEAASASVAPAMAATGAAIGASFGISRDWFRAIFDTTDRWFLGIVNKPEQEEPVKTVSRTYDLRVTPQEKKQNVIPEAPTQRVLMSPSPDVTLTESPILSSTFHRDKLSSAAKQALLGMDHTTAMRH